MLRPRLPRIALSLRRSLHNVPPLTHDFTNGVPGLLSPAGFDIAWTQYQSLMVEKLNNLTVGMPAFICLNGRPLRVIAFNLRLVGLQAEFEGSVV